jgi:hypothetical protein
MWAEELLQMETATFLKYAGALAKMIDKEGFRQFLSDFRECISQ